MMPPAPAGWKPVLAALKSGRAFWITTAVLLILEGALSPVLPRLVPDTVYLRAYLPWQAVAQTRRFLNGELDVIPDPALGWRNRPGHEYRNIRYDRHGSRSAGGLDPDAEKAQRVIFIGDSRTNGYTFVSNAETINAWMETGDVETLNLATAFYGLDQMVLALESAVDRFSPDAAVIGLGSDTGRLMEGHYIPFLAPNEYGMPFLKPRFRLAPDGEETPITPDPVRLLAGLPDTPELLAFLRDRDPMYPRFQSFQRWHCFPLIGLIAETGQRLSHAMTGSATAGGKDSPAETASETAAFRALIRRAEEIGRRNGVSVGFILYPSLAEFLGEERAAYDRAAAVLQSERAPFVDGLALLQQYRGPEDLYADDLHFTAAANRFMAAALSRTLVHPTGEEPVIAR